ncbi:MAG: hypothetical protein KY456_17470 [Chloroflexi bacterium]|nr:hypothetical protein [Chloroflexota bacterium]
MPALDAIATEVRAWYGGYLDTFTSLAAGERTDLESVMGFYGVPLVIVTEGRYLALPTRDAVLSTAKSLIDGLLQANYAGSTVHRLDIRPLNARAAFIEGVFSRHDGAGNELERFGTAYLVAKSDEGWRFISIVVTAP